MYVFIGRSLILVNVVYNYYHGFTASFFVLFTSTSNFAE